MNIYKKALIMHDASDIIIKIKQLREEADWNQAALAKASGVSPAAVSLIEKGERKLSMMVARKFASAFKVSIDELTGEQSDTPKEAVAFFRKWQGIDKLEDEDQKMVTNLIDFLEKKNDRS